MNLCQKNRERNFCATLLVVLCLLTMMPACGSGNTSSSQANNREAASPSKPQRIISLTPSTTEILYGIGAFERVVAVSSDCSYPPQVERLPRLGGWSNPNLEQIAALRPDLAVFSDSQAQFIKDKLEGLGIRTLSVPSRSLEDAFAAIEQVGRATGNIEEAGRLLDETRGKIEAVRSRTRDLPRKHVLCIVDRVPGTLRDLYTATQGSFIAQLIEAAGGESIAPPAPGGWGKIQKEAVVALDPDVIIDMMMQPSEGSLAEDTQAVWRELSQVRAVRTGHVYPVRDPSMIHPSQFVGDTARKLAELIHPEAFAAKAEGALSK